MTQEEKELLIKDLCARLPYGVVVQIINKHPVILGDGNESDEFDEPYNVSLTIDDHDSLIDFFNGDWVTDIKPYLRPMSSMTEEEKKEYHTILDFREKEYGNEVEYFCMETDIHDCFDFLNSHHLDYRGLIPMGLAFPATEDMYNIE